MVLLLVIVLSSCLSLVQGAGDCVCSLDDKILIRSQPDETSEIIYHLRDKQCLEYIQTHSSSKYLKVKVKNQIGFIQNFPDIFITKCKLKETHHNENEVDLRRHKRCFLFSLCDDCMCKNKGCNVICWPCTFFSSLLCNQTTTAAAPTTGNTGNVIVTFTIPPIGRRNLVSNNGMSPFITVSKITGK